MWGGRVHQVEEEEHCYSSNCHLAQYVLQWVNAVVPSQWLTGSGSSSPH